MKPVVSANGKFVTLLATKQDMKPEYEFLKIEGQILLVSIWEFTDFNFNTIEGSKY